MKRIRYFAITLLIPLFFASGTNTMATSTIAGEEAGQVNDRSCSYFYFLWGTHSEYSRLFEEALEAYEKALICDPNALFIEKKLPALHFRLGENDQAIQLLKKGIEKDPSDISQYLLLAHLAIQQNKRDEAIEVYTEALKHDPENENVRLRLAILLVQKDRLDEGETIFRDLIAKNGDLYLARIYLARLLQMRGADDDAAKVYEDALTLNWSPELAFEMVDFYSALERYEDVLRLYDSVIANDSSNQRAIIGRIQTLLAIGKDEDALVELQNLRKTNGNIESLDMAIAKTMLRLEKVDEAKTILESISQGEVASEANYLLGLIAFQEKKMESALGYFQKVPNSSPEYADSIYLQVRILRDFDRFDRAFSLLQKATNEPQGCDPLFFALLSSLYQEKDRLDDALATLTEGTTTFPESEQLHFELALLLERAGKQQEALKAMEKVLEISPNNPEALNYIGYTWANLNINLAEAKKYILLAVEQKPDNGFIRDSLGWVEFRLGNYETARAELLQALDLEPEDPNIHEHLGDVYRALKKYAEAIEAYQKGHDLFSQESDRARMKKKIDELQKKKK
ncbi:tetratricopeptide repeat protein [Desulfopila aestuarii]|uniref:Tetratricopeptide repeat-containing protein n=1 Tax=Desulfopila aestuarii DSM 18488 TaxID=1121416 RepID=A0A1M7YEJ1_9BACT|nr:tetratricopeptide repeat protein [Desulfopila aestuarii]SHO51057.1 Tetratricopeptide repeat-containing protein [Desulfopila aestuarii DSM 18488]